MKVDLTTEEVEMLHQALGAWVKEPSYQAFMGGMIKSVGIQDEQELDNTLQEEQNEMKREMKYRERKSVLLKAKLIEVLDEQTIETLFNPEA